MCVRECDQTAQIMRGKVEEEADGVRYEEDEEDVEERRRRSC